LTTVNPEQTETGSAEGTSSRRGDLRAGNSRDARLLVLYAVTLFVGSGMLFMIQPMFAKMVLPLLGGTPAVWATSMVFFQAALLAGYAYAHWSVARLGLRRQALVHLVLVLIPLILLPVSVPEGWTPPAEGEPIFWLLSLLLIALGLPFFVVSTSAPLLQRWFASTRHPAARDPYFLYGASNLGSMLALLAYPVLMEPRLTLAAQSRLWAGSYGLLAVGTIACAVLLLRSPSRDVLGLPEEDLARRPDKGEVTKGRRIRWVILAFVPSSYVLAVTTHISTDIAAIPLLWVIPLALYLLTFILVFSPKPILPAWPARLQPIVAIPLILALLEGGSRLPRALIIPLSLLAFFFAALVCHSRLAADRPSPGHLTEFYLWIAVGGVLGGVFNALVAPVIFDSVIEYPLAIVMGLLLAPPTKRKPATNSLSPLAPVLLPFVVILLTLFLILGAQRLWGEQGRIVGLALALSSCLILLRRPLRFGLAIAAVMIAATLSKTESSSTLYAGRTFFGVQTVLVDEGSKFHQLLHGTTLHGVQNTDPALRTEPLSYYHKDGPIGQVMTELPAADADQIGVVGLGTGTLACYARPEQQWFFYEIDPVIEKIAQDPELFTFLADCPGEHQIVLGDARLTLEEAPDGRLGVLMVDAFNSDAIPVHLLTREAVQLYMTKLEPNGVLAIHISNRYLDLEPVLADVARSLGLTALLRSDGQTVEQLLQGKTNSDWVVLARKPADLAHLTQDERWAPLNARPDSRVWTDEFSDVFSVFRWR